MEFKKPNGPLPVKNDNKIFSTEIKDFYWVTTKKEYLQRRKTLNNIYSNAVWEHLHSYIIRGQSDICLWKECYNLYKLNGILSVNISINKIAKDLNISTRKVIDILKELDQNNHIVKYISKNKKTDTKNTNIYILGFLEILTNTNENKIFKLEKYLVNRTKELTKEDRIEIINLFNKQLKTSEQILINSNKIIKISKQLFKKIEGG